MGEGVMGEGVMGEGVMGEGRNGRGRYGNKPIQVTRDYFHLKILPNEVIISQFTGTIAVQGFP